MCQTVEAIEEIREYRVKNRPFYGCVLSDLVLD